jgi:hypothetical protein
MKIWVTSQKKNMMMHMYQHIWECNGKIMRHTMNGAGSISEGWSCMKTKVPVEPCHGPMFKSTATLSGHRIEVQIPLLVVTVPTSILRPLWVAIGLKFKSP